MARRQGVAGLLGHPDVVDILPADERAAFTHEAVSATAAALGHIRSLELVVRSVTPLRPVTWKGVALAQLAYGEPGIRSSVDVDLLLARSQVALAVERLVAAGFVAPSGSLEDLLARGREVGLRGPRGDVVELQWAFAPPQDALTLQPSTMRTMLLEVAGVQVATLSPADHLVGLSIHAARERWWRLGWTVDVAALMQVPDLDWDHVVDLCEAHGVGRMVRVSLGLAQEVLGVRAPAFLQRWIRTDAVAAEWVGRVRTGETAGARSGSLLGLHDRRWTEVRSAVRWLTAPTVADLGRGSEARVGGRVRAIAARLRS